MGNCQHDVEVNSTVEKIIALIGLSPIFMGALLHAQTVGESTAAPETTVFTPKTPSANPPAKPLVTDEKTPAGTVPEEAQNEIGRLNALVISGDAHSFPVDKTLTGLHFLNGVEFLQGNDFEKIITPYLGKPATLSDLRRLQKDVIRFCREKRDRLLVDVWYPEQQIENGVVQMVVVEGKVGEIKVVNEGPKYFSDKLVRRQIRIEKGQGINLTRLNRDLEAASRNSFFRDINIALNPAEQVNTSDVELRVQDRFPLRAFVGYEDSGNAVMGENRLLGGINYGNVFGLDHQFNYQYMVDADFKFLKAHSASYIAPISWNQTVTLSGSFAKTKPDLTASGLGAFALDGVYDQAGIRYHLDLPAYRALKHGASLQFDYKRTDNDLVFGGKSVFTNAVEVAEWMFNYEMAVPDRFGTTSFDGQFYFSPGNWTGQNTDADFNSSRTGSDSRYAYTHLQLTRGTKLPMGWTWLLRGTAQFTGDRLLATEQIGAGGYATVRGYEERIANGDRGFIVNSEIYTPPISFGLGRVFGLKEDSGISLRGDQADKLQFLAFVDYGHTSYVGIDVNEPSRDLASVGGGARFKLRTNLSVRLDYGFQIADQIGRKSSRIHMGVVASF